MHGRGDPACLHSFVDLHCTAGGKPCTHALTLRRSSSPYTILHTAVPIVKTTESHCPPASHACADTDGQTFGSFLNGDRNDFNNVDAFGGHIDYTFPQALVHLHMSLGPVGTVWIGRRNDFEVLTKCTFTSKCSLIPTRLFFWVSRVRNYIIL